MIFVLSAQSNSVTLYLLLFQDRLDPGRIVSTSHTHSWEVIRKSSRYQPTTLVISLSPPVCPLLAIFFCCGFCKDGGDSFVMGSPEEAEDDSEGGDGGWCFQFL